MAMELWLDHTLIDIVFEGRNKSYGAYALRKNYDWNMTRAMIIGIAIFIILTSFPMVLKSLKNPQIKDPIVGNDYVFIEPPETKAKNNNPKTDPPKPIKKIPPVRSKIKFLPPKVVKDPDDVNEEPPPAQQELLNKYSGNNGSDSTEVTDLDLLESPGGDEPASSIIEEEVKTVEFISVEQKPEFPGGMKALGKYIQDNLELPNNRINESGQVRFIVDENGFVKDVVVIKSSSAGFEKAVTKVIKEMPQWKSGKHNGKPVKVVFILPVKVQLQ